MSIINRSLNKNVLSRRVQYLMLIIPAAVIFFIGMVLPMIIGLFYSFTDWNGLSPNKNFIGVANYFNIFKSERFVNSLFFTLKFAIVNTIIQNILALAFALILDSNIKAKKLYRTIIFTPVLISAVLVGYVWTRMYADVLPAINDILGTNINFSLFGSSKTVLAGVVIANNWQWVGYWMMIYLAALQSVPNNLYEAAIVDGARGVHKFIHITLPLIAPSITICVIGITTGSLKVYDLLIASTGGGPGHASESIILYIYDMAFTVHKPGFASSVSIVFLVLLAIVAIIQIKLLKQREVQL